MKKRTFKIGTQVMMVGTVLANYLNSTGIRLSSGEIVSIANSNLHPHTVRTPPEGRKVAKKSDWREVPERGTFAEQIERLYKPAKKVAKKKGSSQNARVRKLVKQASRSIGAMATVIADQINAATLPSEFQPVVNQPAKAKKKARKQ